jgi:hypothetical protein
MHLSQSPKIQSETVILHPKATKYHTYIQRLSAHITYAKKTGIEIQTSREDLLLDGLHLKSKLSTSCIISDDIDAYLVFFFDDKLYAFDLKHKHDVLLILGYIQQHNQGLHSRICDTIERTRQVWRLSGKSTVKLQNKALLPITSSDRINTLEEALISYYFLEYRRKAENLTTLNDMHGLHAKRVLSIGPFRYNDIMIEASGPGDMLLHIYENNGELYLINAQNTSHCHIRTLEGDRILPKSIRVTKPFKLMCKGVCVFEMDGRLLKFTHGEMIYDVGLLLKARDRFLSHC